MDDTAHTTGTDPNLHVYDDFIDEEDFEDDYDAEEYEEWEEDDDEEMITTQLGHLGIHERGQTPMAIKVSSSSKKRSSSVSNGLPIGIGALNSKSKIDEPFLILPGLYLGSEAHAKKEDELKRLGVTHVVAIHDRAMAHFPQSFDYLLVPIRDEPGTLISSHFVKTHSYIRDAREKNGGAVFIHCWAGISRSATIVISYIMQLEKLSFYDALHRTLAAKPDVQPNRGFVTQLKAFEKSIGTKSPQTASQSRYTDTSPRYATKGGSWLSKSHARKAMTKGKYHED